MTSLQALVETEKLTLFLKDWAFWRVDVLRHLFVFSQTTGTKSNHAAFEIKKRDHQAIAKKGKIARHAIVVGLDAN